MAPAEETGRATVRAAGVGHSRVWWCCGLLSGPVAFGVSLIAGTMPDFTERVYGQVIGPVTGFALARLTSWIPFSLAEWLLLFAVVHWFGRWFTASRLDGARLRGLGRATALNLRDWSILFVVFTLVFGLQYRRPTLAERMGWTDTVEAGLLERLTTDSVTEVNDLYRALHGTADAGHPTVLADFGATDRALEQSWPAVAHEFRLGRAATWSRGRTKGLLISPLLARLGLSGFYFPWTGEANRNRDVPALSQPQVAAHEKAHQRGIAREDEASFLGWAVARNSGSMVARYSAAMYAHRRLLNALIRTDPGRGQELITARLAGVQRDVDDLHAYWDHYRGPATEVSERVNDRYLRAQRVPDGTASYGRSLRLLLLYAHQRGQTLSP